MLDCAIIGGGPAGLNAALVLGRARRKVALFDDNKPRNAVTRESHGFLTRDGVSPRAIKSIAHKEISRYQTVELHKSRVTNVTKNNSSFEIETDKGDRFHAKTILLATGLKEQLPDIDNIQEYYGRSLFCCPYCDGWELKDKPLVVISRGDHLYHLATTVWNWSHDLLVCTNGNENNLATEELNLLRSKGIHVKEEKIRTLKGENGELKSIVFENREEIKREGGFITPHVVQAVKFGEYLGCETTRLGGIQTDEVGRTNIKGVYAAGDSAIIAPAQVVIAAAEGSRAAIGINTYLIEKEFMDI
ncbi:NAD(P)/FAD-dependent oxidoreductase [Bacillus gobiensis]|uniref:NAD(P)/FAD-dependent oxidoreductase n=1 Tax=Bacillus gobiensis TaxID=1441095 RepID=UPI003D1CAABC